MGRFSFFLAGVMLGLPVGLVLAPSSKPTIDWSDPDNAPPAFEDSLPHGYEAAETLACCARCGGGRNHPIHILAFGKREKADTGER